MLSGLGFDERERAGVLAPEHVVHVTLADSVASAARDPVNLVFDADARALDIPAGLGEERVDLLVAGRGLVEIVVDWCGVVGCLERGQLGAGPIEFGLDRRFGFALLAQLTLAAVLRFCSARSFSRESCAAFARSSAPRGRGMSASSKVRPSSAVRSLL